MPVSGGLTLTGRQRDFLASYPNEVKVDIIEAVDGAIHIYANGDVDSGSREVWVPPEGFLEQPIVELKDPESDLDALGETAEDYTLRKRLKDLRGELSTGRITEVGFFIAFDQIINQWVRMPSRDEMQSHSAVQQIPARLEAIDNTLEDVAANLKLIEIGLDQVTTVIETATAVLERLTKGQ